MTVDLDRVLEGVSDVLGVDNGRISDDLMFISSLISTP
jgi:hypothetical protein